MVLTTYINKNDHLHNFILHYYLSCNHVLHMEGMLQAVPLATHIAPETHPFIDRFASKASCAEWNMYVCTFIRLLPSIPFVWHRPRGAQKLETWPGLLTAHRGRKRELLKELLVLGPWWEKLQMYQLKDAQSPHMPPPSNSSLHHLGDWHTKAVAAAEWVIPILQSYCGMIFGADVFGSRCCQTGIAYNGNTLYI